MAIHVGLETDVEGLAPHVAALLGGDVDEYPRGHIVGLVDIVDEHPAGDCPMTGPCAVAADGFSWAVFVSKNPSRTVHHWILANAHELEKPIEVRGVQGMVDLPREIEQRVAADPARRKSIRR